MTVDKWKQNLRSLAYNNQVIAYLASDSNGDTIQYEKK